MAAVGFVLPAVLIIAAVQFLVGQAAALAAEGVFALAVIVLIPVAQFTGTRYRLSRTQWRGVRFGLDGSPWIFAGKTMLARLVMIATVGLAAPQAVLALERYRLDRVQFGELAGRLNAHWREAPWLSWILPLLVVLALLAAYVAVMLFALAQSGQVDAPAEAQNLMLLVLVEYGALLEYAPIALLALVLLAPILFVWHQARFIRFLCTRWGLRGDGPDDWLALYPPQKPGAYVRLLIGNYLLLLFTFGLATPFVWRRTMRFLERFILVNTDVLETAAQSALERPKRGEGLLGAFDVGVV